MSAPAAHDPQEPGWGVWVHAITAADDGTAQLGVSGIGGADVDVVPAAGLCAIVSPVRLDDFAAERLEPRLEDLSWLASTAREHHRVVEAVASRGPAVPAALATVYRDRARLAADLGRHRSSLRASLARVSGRTEWGVKAFASAGGEPDDAGTPDAQNPGAAYLKRRRAQLSARERRQRDAAEGAEEVHRVLSGIAALARQHPQQDPRLSGEGGATVLNGAYLVDDERTAAFERAVDELAGRHAELRLTLTGPWPPYSFAAAPAAPSPEGAPA